MCAVAIQLRQSQDADKNHNWSSHSVPSTKLIFC